MTSTPFTRNYRDHSNNEGFQFEFFCDKCGSGFRSSFATNALGLASDLLKAAGSLFGGAVASAGWGADHVKDAFRGKAWDDAYAAAIAECKPHFHQCGRCGHWVCPDVCWSEGRGLCQSCAPDLQQEAAVVQAQVAVDQVREKARQTDQTAGMNMTDAHAAVCPHCSARVTSGGKFCEACGQPFVTTSACAKCKAPMSATAKFCGSCGAPRGP
jgi:hypothetical protein